jgi:tRNA G37 N-methylase Trm5
MCQYGHGVQSNQRVLEPSAGTGNLARIISRYSTDVVAVELNKRNHALMVHERALGMTCINYDFLRLTPDSASIGLFDWVIMCPPRNSDEHIDHASNFLAPGGNLLALVQEQNVDLSRYGFYSRLPEMFEINGEHLNCGIINLWAGH